VWNSQNDQNRGAQTAAGWKFGVADVQVPLQSLMGYLVPSKKLALKQSAVELSALGDVKTRNRVLRITPCIARYW
jgi:hypothetical protein